MAGVPGSGRVPTHAEVLDHLGLVVFGTDAVGRITTWNSRAAEVFGWTAQEAIGRPREELLAPYSGDRMPVATQWQESRRLRRRDGSFATALVRNSPVIDGDGKCIGSVAAAIDLDDPELAGALQAHAAPGDGRRARVLSPREREILAMLARGLTGEQIAQRLVLSPETIRTHIRNAREKLGASTRVEAVTMAVVAREIEI